MILDFKVGQSNELVRESRVYDLHNCFDFDNLDISRAGEIRLSFKANPFHGAGYSTVLLLAQDVDRFALSPDFDPTKIRDIEEMGYKSPGDEDDSWLLTQEQAKPSDDLFFRFNDGHYVRLHSARVSLIEMPPTPDSECEALRG